jgi:hypothetical protein
MLAFSAACGATVAWLVTLIHWLGAALPMRRLPKATLVVFSTGIAWLITWPWLWMTPLTA